MNYKKIYLLAITEILKEHPLRMYLVDAESYTVVLNNYCMCFLPKDKNIFALKIRELPDGVKRLLPKSNLVEVYRTDKILDTKPKARLIETEDGKEYAYCIDNALLSCFDRNAEIKINPNMETSPFYIYENGELVGIIAPIRRKK
ncbi:hypothetical protein [Dialister invisus]|uniref:hypothetical protein n=1 Tax=Dialister invisus TaxID=218538 RepID=UPI002674AC68|nr:hypothetical protein [Dialister invisus]